jgi:hypothetical protein
MSAGEDPDQPHEAQVGRHVFRWEPPDIAVGIFRGDLGGEEARQIRDMARVIALSVPYVLYLIDMTAMGSFSPEARRQLGGSKVGRPVIRGVAVFGASSLLRTIVTVVARGSALITGEKDSPLCVSATEAEARAFLAERRRIARGQRTEG